MDNEVTNADTLDEGYALQHTVSISVLDVYDVKLVQFLAENLCYRNPCRFRYKSILQVNRLSSFHRFMLLLI
jgi:hypothetical protein